jgi:hypothetical protein
MAIYNESKHNIFALVGKANKVIQIWTHIGSPTHTHNKKQPKHNCKIEICPPSPFLHLVTFIGTTNIIHFSQEIRVDYRHMNAPNSLVKSYKVYSCWKEVRWFLFPSCWTTIFHMLSLFLGYFWAMKLLFEIKFTSLLVIFVKWCEIWCI